jgi:hypothetical protein
MSYPLSHPRSVVVMVGVILTLTLLGSALARLAPTQDPSRGTPLVAHEFPDQPTLARKGAPGSPAASEPPPTYQQFNLTSDGQ